MTESELLETMGVERARMMEAIGEVPVELGDLPGAIEDWSVKEPLAHMLAWEEDAVRRLQRKAERRKSAASN